jgi:hypothetical protein
MGRNVMGRKVGDEMNGHREKVNAFTQVFALISENTSLNAFLFSHGMQKTNTNPHDSRK